MPTVVEIQGAKVRGSYEPGNYSNQTTKSVNIYFIFETPLFLNICQDFFGFYNICDP